MKYFVMIEYIWTEVDKVTYDKARCDTRNVAAINSDSLIAVEAHDMILDNLKQLYELVDREING